MQKLSHGGKIELDYLFIALFSLVSFYNVADQIIKGQNLIERAPYTVPFIIPIIVILIIKRNKYIAAFLFLAISIPTTILEPNISGHSGLIYSIFSIHCIKNKKYGAVVIGLNLVAITCRSIMMGDTIPGAMVMVLIYGAGFYVYYFLIYKDSAPARIRFKNLLKEEKELIRLMGEEGHLQKTAGSMVKTLNGKKHEKGLSISQTSEMVKHIRTKTGYIDLSQVLFYARDSEQFNNKSTK